jgi:serine/threonine protein kinase
MYRHINAGATARSQHTGEYERDTSHDGQRALRQRRSIRLYPERSCAKSPKNRKHLSSRTCRHISRLPTQLHLMLDISRGLEYLHLRKPSVIHRDCKSSNILITSKVTAKIADFGLAKVKQSTRSMVRSLVGTVNWQAPELWHPHPKYDHKVDVFSCALVFWEIMQWHIPSKKFPWEVSDCA